MSKEKGNNKKLINTDVRTANDESHRNTKEEKQEKRIKEMREKMMPYVGIVP